MESDIMRDVKSMSHTELKKYAKELGIEIEDVKKIKKEGLIEKIKAHFEQKVIESAKQAAENEDKPKTRKKKVLKKQAAVEEPVEEPVVVEEPAPVKKSSRRKEKSTEQVEQPVEEKAKVVKKKTKKIPTTETVEEPVQVEVTPVKEKKTKKVTKKTSKKSKDEVVEEVKPVIEHVVEQPEEVEVHSSAKAVKKVRKVKKTTKSTPTKKTKKTKSTRGVTVEPVVEHSPESRNEPLILTNSPEPIIQSQEAPKPQEIIVQQQAPVTPRPSRQSVSKLSESAKQILSKSASKATNKPTRSSARLSKSFNTSLLTDDDEDKNEEADITNDVQNATFDKPTTSSQPVTEQLKPSLLASVMNSAKKVLACSSFYLSSATNNSPFKIPPIASEPAKIASPTLAPTQEPPKAHIVPPVIEPEASQVQSQASTDPASNPVKRTGGARIVKPTQTVLIKTTIVKENNVVVEQLREEKVEAVRREAGGPRIVKPVEEKIDTKKTKIPESAGDRAKKIKSSIESIPNSKSANDIAKKSAVKPVPDFKTLHNKEANKFESIDAWADRVQQRHTNIGEAMKKKLTPAKKQPEGKSVPAIVVSAPPAELTSNKETKLPLVNKKLAVAQHIKMPNSTSTPNFNESALPNKIDMAQAPFMSTPNNRDPATPKLNGPKNDAKLTLSTVKKQPQQQPKTPASASRPKPQFNQLLKAAVTNNASQQSGAVEASKPVGLQAPPTGSFQRRKSFDLTASLSKPLKYKQYTGKLKPVDFNAKTLFLNNLAQTGGGDKTMVKMNTTGVKSTANTSSVNVLKSITNDNTAKSGTLTSATPSKKPVIGSIVKSSLSGLRTDKTEIAGIAKAEKLNTNLDKSRSLIKKAKAEQISQSRQQQIDSTRNIENRAIKS